jgi:predicted dehydrogenase
MRKIERLRIGIIGTGWGARVQVPAFRLAGADVVAIAGHDPARTVETARALDVPNSFNDWHRLLDSPDIDLISVVTPPSLHREMAIAALESGRHVLSEKPTALNAAEAEAMLQASEARPQQLALIDHELRLLPAWLEARARIPEIGQVRYVEARYSSPGRGDRRREWNWWSEARHGGGILGAVGSHLIDAIRYLVGEIAAVSADLETIIDQRPWQGATREVTSDDLASLRLRLSEGGGAVMTLSAVAAVDEPTTIVIHGEHGGFRLVEEELQREAKTGGWVRVAGNDPQKMAGNSAGGAFGTGTLLLGRALDACLVQGKSEQLRGAATFSDGLAQQRVLDAARESAKNSGMWISVDSGEEATGREDGGETQ